MSASSQSLLAKMAKTRLTSDSVIRSVRASKAIHKRLDPCTNVLEFSRRYGLVLPPAGEPVDFDRYSHLKDLAEDTHPHIIAMAGAQTGKSSWMLTSLLRFGVLHWGSFFGAYYPNQKLANDFSTLRFAPFVRSNKEIAEYLGTDTAEIQGVDSVTIRTLGPTAFLFLTTRGLTSTEGFPLKGIFLDEVRRMKGDDVHRVMMRIEAQRDPVVIAGSTAHWPDSDIHAMFKAGDQRFFHTACKCPEGCVLALTFPDCVVDLKGASPEFVRKVEHAYATAGLPFCGVSDRELERFGAGIFVCPRCGTVLTHPRRGWWEQHNPGVYVHSYQFPQMLSPASSAPKCAQQLHRPTTPMDLQEAYNSMAGMPFISSESTPVHLEHLQSCVNPDLRWAMTMSEAWRRENVTRSAMGIDHMGGYICAVIKGQAPNGKHRDLHVEVISGDPTKGEDAWFRVYQLMLAFDVSVCVVEDGPNYNESLRFATAFPGRVWLLAYSGGDSVMVDWKDRRKLPANLKGDDDTKFKYRVMVHRVKAMQWSLARWRTRDNETPHPMGLIQELPVAGGKPQLTPNLRAGHLEPVAIALDVYWEHLMRTGFEKVYEDEGSSDRHKLDIKGVGVADPHFSFSGLMADVALSRIVGNSPT